MEWIRLQSGIRALRLTPPFLLGFWSVMLCPHSSSTTGSWETPTNEPCAWLISGSRWVHPVHFPDLILCSLSGRELLEERELGGIKTGIYGQMWTKLEIGPTLSSTWISVYTTACNWSLYNTTSEGEGRDVGGCVFGPYLWGCWKLMSR